MQTDKLAVSDLDKKVARGLKWLANFENPQVGKILQEVGKYWQDALSAETGHSPLMSVAGQGGSFTDFILFLSGGPLAHKPETLYKKVITISQRCAQVAGEESYRIFCSKYDSPLKEALKIDQ